MESHSVDADIIERIAQLILATKTHAGLTSIDRQLMVDVDLRILGETPERFAAYDKAIRAEYAWIPEADYKKGRAAVLQSFVDRQWIFQTDLFRETYELFARANLARALDALR